MVPPTPLGGFIVSAIDMTGRRKAEAFAQDSERRTSKSPRDASIRLCDAVEALEDGCVLFDADDRAIIANRRYVEMSASHTDRNAAAVLTRDLLVTAAETGHFVDPETWLED